MKKKTNFVPQSREEAVKQFLAVADQYAGRESAIAQAVAMHARAKAKALRQAEDWQALLHRPLDQF